MNVNGDARFRAVANGDPTCLELFHVPSMSAFSGKLILIVQSKDLENLKNPKRKSNITATAKGLKNGNLMLGIR